MKKINVVVLLAFSLALSGCTVSADRDQSKVGVASSEISETESADNNTGETKNTSALAEAEAEKILVYLSGPEAMLTELEKGFEAERGDVADFLIMSCGEVRNKVWTEKEAGEIQADVVWGSDPLIYNKLDDEGLLKNLSSIENTAYINEEFKTEHNYLYANRRYVTIICNTKTFSEGEAPAGFEDLLREQYKDRIVMADAAQSSTALGIASCLYQLKGETYIGGLHTNGMLLTKSNGQVPSLILEGQYDLGIAPHDAVIRLQNKAKKEGYEISIDNIWPEEGAIAINRPIAIIKKEERGEKEQKIAEELVNYLLTKEAQTITTKYGFVSVRNDIADKYLPEGVEKINIDWEAASENEDVFKELYEQIFQS